MIDFMTRAEGEHFGFMGRDDVHHLERLGQSPDCQTVLTAIAKRLELAIELHRKLLTDTYGESCDFASRFADSSFEEEVARLVGAISESLRVVPFYEGATAGERKQLATKVVTSVQELKHALGQLTDEEGQTPVFKSLDAFASGCAKETIKGLIDRSDAATEYYSTAAKMPVVGVIAEFSALNTACQPEKMLDALLEGFATWAKEEPLLPRPLGKNSDRLRMIRILTAHFRRRYGTPLRAQVLAIVGMYFDARNLSESDIAKLAP